MSLASANVQNYVNTIIFCVVMKIVSVLLLAVILMGWADRIVYFLVTIEVGIVIVVILALWNIRKYEKQLEEEAKNMLKSTLTNVICPDFHTLDEETCEGNYTTPNGRYTYQFIGGKTSVTMSNYQGKQLETICTTFHNDAYNVDEGTYKYPWTDLSSKCDVV